MTNNLSAISSAQLIQRMESGSNKTSNVAPGISFIETMADAARQGKIVVPFKEESAGMNFERNKFLNVEEVSWFGDEEEMVKSFIGRIERIIKESKKS